MPDERKVTMIPAKPKFPAAKKVGIYCRVSSRSQEQLQSLSTQVSYLTKLVVAKPGWFLCDIYIDVKTGASSSERSEFQRLLSDCRENKINVIITKSISRFGRNTEETLSTIREMRSIGVEIVFELEEVSTSDPSSELLISILAGVA